MFVFFKGRIVWGNNNSNYLEFCRTEFWNEYTNMWFNSLAQCFAIISLICLQKQAFSKQFLNVYSHLFALCVWGHLCGWECLWKSQDSMQKEAVLHCGFWGLNSDPCTWWQVSLPDETFAPKSVTLQCLQMLWEHEAIWGMTFRIWIRRNEVDNTEVR